MGQPLDPAKAVAAHWDNDKAIATVIMEDGSKYRYTRETVLAMIPQQSFDEHRYPENFVHMYNYVAFGVLPDDKSTDKNHEGMVQGYDGTWRWL
jgi:hypothetical protein